MIDLVYKTLSTILNKENTGHVSPTEFNVLANNVQLEIVRGYFEDENRDKNRQNAGSTNKGYANLPFNERQRIDQFAAVVTIPLATDRFNLPADLYFIEDDGITSGTNETQANVVIEEAQRNRIGYLNRSIAAPTELYPVYERYGPYIIVYPIAISEIVMRYIRQPLQPNWTFQTVTVNGKDTELFNPADVAYQDFELHESEFSNIVLKMLSYFGINLREADVIQVAETLKDKTNIKENV